MQTERQNNNTNLDLWKYQAAMTVGGILALLGMWLHIEELFYLLILAGVVELIASYRYSPLAFLIHLVYKPLKLEQHDLRYNIPPSFVLKVQSSAMIVFSGAYLYLQFVNNHYSWMPASFLGAMWIWVGTTGLCPLAIILAWVKSRNELVHND